MKNIFILILFIALHFSMWSQEKIGIVNSNYHPVSSIHFNASTTVDSRTYMQLNLAGANAFLTSNAAYFPQFGFWNFLATQRLPRPLPKTSKLNKYLYANVVVDGPAFTISKNNFGAGFFVRGRSVIDVRRMPYEFTDFLVGITGGSTDEVSALNLKNARISNMTWAEYGVNFGMMAVRRKNNLLTIGGNVKYLTGFNLLFVNIGALDAEFNSSGLTVHNVDGKIRTAAPAFGNGNGYGMDLGVTYKKMLKHVDGYNAHSKRSNCEMLDYKYKVGLSLRDLGYINFKRGTRAAEFYGSGEVYDMLVSSEPETVLQNDFNAVFTDGQKIRATLPTALAGQLDYNFENNIYLNASINKNIVPNSFTGVQSSDFLSIAPRFETRMLEVAVPFTLQRFMNPQVGFAFRFRSFVFGVDNVVPFVVKSNTSTLNFYFNLTISLFRSRSCKNGIRGIDDCFKFKWRKSKIKRKNTMISPRPRKK